MMNTAVQPPRDRNDFTHLDLSGHFAGVTSRGQVLATFEYVRVPVKSRTAGRKSSYETRLVVRLKPMGERYTEAIEQITEEDAMRLFPQEFSNFKNFQDVPTRGTPLSELPGMSVSMISLCVINGLRSVEDLASVSDDAAAQCGMDVSSAHRLAKQWVSKRDQNAAVIDSADEVASLIETNRVLTNRLRAMEVSMRAMEIAAAQRPSGTVVPPDYQGQLAGESVSSGLPGMDDLPDMPMGGGVVTGIGDLADEPNPLAN